MTAPNIAGLTTIIGKSVGVAVGTNDTTLVFNNASSAPNKVFKINSVVVSNVDGTNSATVQVKLRKNATTNYFLARTITVPANATLVVVTKEMQLYLEENDSILVIASADGDLEAICSYEEIS
jgi:hypothetical protein|tara:strand:- start:1518 stop:1886 length:369 start_codon:yes stop_codon:yes gene_type:complete